MYLIFKKATFAKVLKNDFRTNIFDKHRVTRVKFNHAEFNEVNSIYLHNLHNDYSY